MSVRVKLNLRGIREVKASGGVRWMLQQRMARVEAAAQSAAPVESGAYQASIRMWDDTSALAGAVMHVGSDVDYAMLIEAGTGNLSRALDSAGGS